MFKEIDNRLKKIERLLEERQHNNVVFLNIDEASDFIKMKKSSVYQLVYQRKIPFYKSPNYLHSLKPLLISIGI